MSTAEALIGRRGHRRATLSVILGSAGDRPDDYLRELGVSAGSRADEVAIKEMIPYLRGRTREGVVGELREGLRAAGVNIADVPVYHDEVDALRGELTTPGRLAATDDGTPRVLLAPCHRLRDEINALLLSLGASVVDRRGRDRRLPQAHGRRRWTTASKPTGSPEGSPRATELVAELARSAA